MMKMLKIAAIVISMFSVLMSSHVNAKDGEGTIEEIINCGSSGFGDWKHNLLFKLSDGSWFGVYADHDGRPEDHDSNFAVSMVMMAFASKLPVTVKATYTTGTQCGVTAAYFWDKKDDYIKIAR